MQILNQPTSGNTITIYPESEPLTINFDYPMTPTDGESYSVVQLTKLTPFSCSDEASYWLYNKDVPIPKIPKCISSRIHSDRRLGWGNSSKVKTPPVVDAGWNKEKA